MYITTPVQCIICCYSSLACVWICASDFVSSYCVSVNSKHLQNGRLAIKTAWTQELHYDCSFSHACCWRFLRVSSVSGCARVRPFTARVVRIVLSTCVLTTSSGHFCTEFVDEKECQFLYSAECLHVVQVFPFWPSAFVVPATRPLHVGPPSSVRFVTRSQRRRVQDLKCSAIWAVTKLHTCALRTLVMFMLPLFLATFCAPSLHWIKA